MEFWNDMINTALLGTEKKPMMPPAYPPELNEAARQITNQAGLDKEEQFLQLAAVASNVRQSGSKPLHQPAANFPQAVAESFPYCSQRAVQILKDILEEECQPLVVLWLERCLAAQKLVLPEMIPILFNRAIQHKEIRQSVAKVSGRRGEWLSRFNAAWEFSNNTDEEQLWQTGTLDQRKAILKQMRGQDPARTREWLTQSWPQENANARTELLKQLDGTIEPEDEPFLLNPLNEKSQKVKDEAIRLLKQLPNSILVKKYAETAEPLITIKKEKALLGLTTKTTLSIQPPLIPEKADYLPGIDYLSPNKTFTDGEFVLYQLIEHIPPTFWEQHLALTPKNILDYFTGPYEKYVSAFAKAAAQFKELNWAKAYITQRDAANTALLQLLPLPEREARIIQNLQKHQDSDGQIQQATQWPEEWSHDLARQILSYTAVQPWRWTSSFYYSQILKIPVSIAPLLKTIAPAEPAHAQQWAKMADQLALLLRLKEQTQNTFND
jgi:hypothetical protein